ncbi:MAG: beta-ketoacyl-ACP synthase I, partial [Pseudomonadota bacterium]|nr:beta-ketoacyl-ACP synthase I [Pseudomonadota bacterium]
MRRAVITGAGIVSCLGNNLEEVRSALYGGRSAIRFNQSNADIGMLRQIRGSVHLNAEYII